MVRLYISTVCLKILNPNVYTSALTFRYIQENHVKSETFSVCSCDCFSANISSKSNYIKNNIRI